MPETKNEAGHGVSGSNVQNLRKRRFVFITMLFCLFIRHMDKLKACTGRKPGLWAGFTTIFAVSDGVLHEIVCDDY